jgi:tetratricopeptide (TPR) repeat protein
MPSSNVTSSEEGIALGITGSYNTVNINLQNKTLLEDTKKILRILEESQRQQNERATEQSDKDQQLKTERRKVAERLVHDSRAGSNAAENALRGLMEGDLQLTESYLQQAEQAARLEIHQTAADHAAARTRAAAAACQLAAISDTLTARAALRRAVEYTPTVLENWGLLGDVEAQSGDLVRAHQSYGKALKLANERAHDRPDDTNCLRNLSVAHNKIGDIQAAQNNLVGALNAYHQGLQIRENLAQKDPQNAAWQRDLSVSHNKIGDIQRTKGDLLGALSSYHKGLIIFEKLARQDPVNAEWQRNLSVSQERIGDIQQAWGDLVSALASYQNGLKIHEYLAQKDPKNMGWQRDLSVSYLKIGDIQRLQGELDSALSAYHKGLTISERLTQRDLANAQWQYDLSVVYGNIGDIQLEQDEPLSALISYHKGLEIRTKLAQQAPANTEWQRHLSMAFNQIGDAKHALNNPVGALAAYRKALAISERLLRQDPRYAGGQTDVVVSCWKLARLHGQGISRYEAIYNLKRGCSLLEQLAHDNQLNDDQKSWLTFFHHALEDIVGSAEDERSPP